MEDKKEIIIGRQGDLQINDPAVSREHAKITRTSDGIYIEDLDSKGGTYVNGKQIRKMKLKPTDDIKLATFSIRYQRIEQAFPLTDKEFSLKFQELKGVYDTYTRERVKMQSQSQAKTMLKRFIPMAIPGVLMMAMRNLTPAAMPVGIVLSIAAVVGGNLLAAREQRNIPFKLQELEEKFKVDYTCPSCNRYFGAQQSWELLCKMGKCPYCNRAHNL